MPERGRQHRGRDPFRSDELVEPGERLEQVVGSHDDFGTGEQRGIDLFAGDVEADGGGEEETIPHGERVVLGDRRAVVDESPMANLDALGRAR